MLMATASGAVRLFCATGQRPCALCLTDRVFWTRVIFESRFCPDWFAPYCLSIAIFRWPRRVKP